MAQKNQAPMKKGAPAPKKRPVPLSPEEKRRRAEAARAEKERRAREKAQRKERRRSLFLISLSLSLVFVLLYYVFVAISIATRDDGREDALPVVIYRGTSSKEESRLEAEEADGLIPAAIDARALRRAVVMAEVLGKPKALQRT